MGKNYVGITEMSIETTTCILKIKDNHSIEEIAAECLSVFGKGGNPDALIIEEFIGFVNSPIQNGYIRAMIDKSFGMALEYIQENGGSELVDLIKVEWEGQEMFQVGEDESGNPIHLGIVPGTLKSTII